MTHKPTTENFPDDEFDTLNTDAACSVEQADESPDLVAAGAEKSPRRQSAWRSIEEWRERERLRRELEELEFESDRPIELD